MLSFVNSLDGQRLATALDGVRAAVQPVTTPVHRPELPDANLVNVDKVLVQPRRDVRGGGGPRRRGRLRVALASLSRLPSFLAGSVAAAVHVERRRAE